MITSAIAPHPLPPIPSCSCSNGLPATDHIGPRATPAYRRPFASIRAEAIPAHQGATLASPTLLWRTTVPTSGASTPSGVEPQQQTLANLPALHCGTAATGPRTHRHDLFPVLLPNPPMSLRQFAQHQTTGLPSGSRATPSLDGCTRPPSSSLNVPTPIPATLNVKSSPSRIGCPGPPTTQTSDSSTHAPTQQDDGH